MQKTNEHLNDQEQSKNETRKRSRNMTERGITLIALVITIIIMLILAGITLSTVLGENGLIERAKKAAATYKKAEEDESKGIEQLIDEMDKVNGGNGETEPSPEPTETTEPTPENTPSPDPTPDPTPEVSVGELNSKVEENPGSVLGKDVTGLNLKDDLQGKNEYTWQIFDVDASHIWLIAKDYIQLADCPQKSSYKVKPYNHDLYRGDLTEVKHGYDGAANVASELQSLNQQFFENASSSTNTNAKMMAYLLDKEIWTNKFIGDTSKVDYVIGGPTLEQIVSVHNKKHPNDTISTQSTTTGYKISKASSGWVLKLDDALNTSDSELVITDTGKSNFMWVASPAHTNTDDCLMEVNNSGDLTSTAYDILDCGSFRPVVALKSDVLLEESNGVYTIK